MKAANQHHRRSKAFALKREGGASIMLTSGMHAEWLRSFHDNPTAQLRIALQHVQANKRPELKEPEFPPSPPPSPSTTQGGKPITGEDGLIVTRRSVVQRGIDLKKYEREHTSYQRELKAQQDSHCELFGAMNQRMSDGVKAKLDTSYRKEILAIQADDWNCVELVNLLQRVCAGLGADQLDQFMGDLRILKWRPYNEINDYLAGRETLISKCEDAGHVFKDHEKTKLLATSMVPPEVWSGACPSAWNREQTAEGYPLHADLKQGLITFAKNVVQPVPVEADGSTKRKNPPDAEVEYQEPRHKKKKQKGREPQKADIFRVVVDKLDRLEKATTELRKQHPAPAANGHSGRAPCFRCGLTGHFATDCKVLSKCTKCGKCHMTKFHDEIVSRYTGKSAQNTLRVCEVSDPVVPARQIAVLKSHESKVESFVNGSTYLRALMSIRVVDVTIPLEKAEAQLPVNEPDLLDPVEEEAPTLPHPLDEPASTDETSVGPAAVIAEQTDTTVLMVSDATVAVDASTAIDVRSDEDQVSGTDSASVAVSAATPAVGVVSSTSDPGPALQEVVKDSSSRYAMSEVPPEYRGVTSLEDHGNVALQHHVEVYNLQQRLVQEIYNILELSQSGECSKAAAKAARQALSTPNRKTYKGKLFKGKAVKRTNAEFAAAKIAESVVTLDHLGQAIEDRMDHVDEEARESIRALCKWRMFPMPVNVRQAGSMPSGKSKGQVKAEDIEDESAHNASVIEAPPATSKDPIASDDDMSGVTYSSHSKYSIPPHRHPLPKPLPASGATDKRGRSPPVVARAAGEKAPILKKQRTAAQEAENSASSVIDEGLVKASQLKQEMDAIDKRKKALAVQLRKVEEEQRRAAEAKQLAATKQAAEAKKVAEARRVAEERARAPAKKLPNPAPPASNGKPSSLASIPVVAPRRADLPPYQGVNPGPEVLPNDFRQFRARHVYLDAVEALGLEFKLTATKDERRVLVVSRRFTDPPDYQCTDQEVSMLLDMAEQEVAGGSRKIIAVADVSLGRFQLWKRNQINPTQGPDHEGDIDLPRGSSVFMFTTRPSSVMEKALVDTGAMNAVLKRSDQSPHFKKTPNRRLDLCPFGGGPSIPADSVGTTPALGLVAICAEAQQSVLGVAEICRRNLGVKFVFDDKEVRVTHPNLRRPIIGELSADNQYLLSLDELEPLEQLHKPRARINPVTVGETPRKSKVIDASTATEVTGEPQGADRVAALGLSVQEVKRAKQCRVMHCTFAHPSSQALANLLDNGTFTGCHLSGQDVWNADALLGPCLSCVIGKAKKPHYTASVADPCTRIGERVYADIIPLEEDGKAVKTVGGNSFALIAIDGYSSFMHVEPLVSKDREALQASFVKIIASYKANGHTITEVHTDAESNLKSCKVFFGNSGIKYVPTPPHQHCQRVERAVQSMLRKMACLTASTPIVLPSRLMGETIRTVVYHINDVPTAKDAVKSPREKFTGVKLDISKRTMIPYGTVATLLRPEDGTQKGQLGVVLGPDPDTYNANHCYAMDTGKVVTRGRVDIMIVEVIPEHFPWEVKSGVSTISIPKKARRVKHSDNPTSLKGVSVTDTSGEHSRRGDWGNTSGKVGTETASPTESTSRSEPTSTTDKTVRVSSPPNLTLKRKIVEANPTRDKTQRTGAQLMMDQEARTQAALDAIRDTVKQSIEAIKAVTGYEPTEDPYRKEYLRKDDPKQNETPAQSTRRKGVLVERRYPRRNKDSAMRAERQARKVFASSTQAIATEINKIYNLSVREALKGEREQESREAILSEIQNMLHYKVGHYLHFANIPVDKRKNILQSFMFIKHKTTPDGQYDKTKARMVCNGANQKEHMYDLVASSTVALSSVFLLMNLASFHRAKLTTYDIKGAFLHAEFSEKDEVTYIRINKEITALWIQQDPSAAPFVDERGTLILELDKFIYGLKQSPLKFQLNLVDTLIALGYRQLTQDECLFVKHVGKDFSVLSTHVDDILQMATCEQLYQELKSGLIAKYVDITTTEEGTSYLGMTIERSKCKRFIKLSQVGLTEKVLMGYPKVPGDLRRHASPADDDLFDVEVKPETRALTAAQTSEYLSVLMTVMYLARLTRPDILMPVTFLASRTHCATNTDMRHLLNILRYLENTKELGVYINCDSLQIRCTCDASYAVHSPGTSCKGHTGYNVGMGENMSYLHTRSGKQKTASTSSTDAEVIALCEALKMCIWLRAIVTELKVTELRQITVYQDNKSVIMMSTVETAKKRSKHLLTKLTYIKALVDSQAVDVQYLNTKEMTADVLSKSLHGLAFVTHITRLMGLHWSGEVTGKSDTRRG